jgi:hypothetical protein
MTALRPTKAAQEAADALHLPTLPLIAPSHPADGPTPVFTDILGVDIFKQANEIGKLGTCIMRLNTRSVYLVCLNLAKPELSEDIPQIGAQLQYSLNNTSATHPHEAIWLDFGPRQLGNFAAVLPFPVPTLRLLVWDGIWNLQARKLGA